MNKPTCILVVDDDESALGKFSKFLSGAGYEVIQAVTGAEGLELIQDRRPEVALLDVMLPDVSGFEVCRRVRGNAALVDTFMVLMSGAATRGGHKSLKLDQSADAYMLKSADEGEFLARIRTFVRLQATTAALRASESTYRQLTDNIREVFWMTDPEKNKIIYVSPGYEAIWGRSCQSLYVEPRDWMEAIHPEDCERVLAAALTRQKTGDYDEIYRILRPDGTLRWIHDRAFPVRDEAGKVYRITGLAEDITERKLAEARIATLAHAVESTSEMICITDLEDHFTFVNRAFQDMYGYSETELVGKSPQILLSPNNPPALMAEILAQTRAGSWRGEVLDRRKDGTEFPVFLTTSQIRDPSGRVLGLMGVAEDITERKWLERRGAAFSNLRQRLSAADTREQAAEIILEVGSELFGWDAGYVIIYSPAEDKILPLVIVDTVGQERHEYPASSLPPEPTPMMRRVLQEGAILVNAKKDSIAELKLVRFGNVARSASSMMFVPIHMSSAAVGVVSIQSYSPDAYSAEDLQVLQRMADVCSGSLQRIEAAEALREAEARYRGIFENATEGIFQTTSDGRYLNANPALARMFGYQSPVELIAGVTNIERQTFASAQNAQELKNLLAVQELVVEFEAERYRKDGARIWTSINVSKVRDAKGEFLYYEGTVQDITKRKRAEKENSALSRLGYRLSAAITAEQAAAIGFEMASELFDWDAGYVHLYSKAEDKIIPILTMDTVEGKRTLVPPESFTLDPSPLMRLVMEQGARLCDDATRPSPVPNLVPFGDSSRRSSSRMYVAIRAANEVFGIFSIQSYSPGAYTQQDLESLQTMASYCGNTFRRIQASERLRLAELKYRSIFENATEGIFQTTPEGQFLAANPALARIFGYGSPEEMIARVADVAQQMYVSPERRAEFKRTLETQGSVQGFEAEGCRKDGGRIWVSASARVVAGDNGQAHFYEGTVSDITVRKQSEEQLRKLSRAVEQSPASVVITDVEGNIEHVNAKFTEITGYTLEEVRGRNPRMLKSGWTPSEGYAELWRTITNGGEWRGEFHNRKKNGTLYWEAASISPIYDATGRITHFVAVKEDITERKRMEKKLIAFTNLGYRLSAASGVEEAARIILGIAAELFGWDSGFVHLYSPLEDKIVRVLTMDVIDGRRVITPPAQRAADLSPLMRGVMREGPRLINRTAESDPAPNLHAFGDPNRRSASMMYAPIRTGGGVLGIMSIQSYSAHAFAEPDLQLLQVMADHCGDALQRIKVAEALREAERELRLISENATDAIFAFDMERRPVYANPAAEELTGYTFAEIQERGFINWIHPDDQDQMLKLWESLYAGKGYSEVEFRLITKVGQMKWCSSTWGPLFDESGRQVGVQGRERDVSQRKQLEIEILEISTAERRRIGHELHDGLGQYLAGIAFRAKALEQQLAAVAPLQAEQAKELVTLMGQAISQTRTLARGMAPVDVEASGLAAALQNLAAETTRLFKICCQVSCADPDLQVDAEIGLELYRICQEAIHNALEHGEAQKIEMRLDIHSQTLSLQIIDDGRGFKVEDTASTGMGLRVMGYRARSIGGNLKVSSETGRGTEVRCVVPLACVVPNSNGQKTV